MYDSTEDTFKHISRVQQLIAWFCEEMVNRAKVHDLSKLQPPEKQLFDKYTPLLKKLAYGSDEYKAALNGLGEALTHHYENNDHHPEYHENGIWDMDLFMLVEMMMDWKAATERHENGDIIKSMHINRERFGIEDQLFSIMFNTAAKLKDL